jgi:hypothetical protein
MRRRAPSTAGFALGAFAVVLLVVALGRMLPFLAEQRQITSAVPVPPPLFRISPVQIDPGRQACADKVALDERSGVAAIHAAPRTAGVPRLAFTARSGAYRARGAFRGGLGPHGDVLEASFAAPPGPRSATVCVRNAGRRPVALVGTEEPRTATRSTTTIDGLTQPDLALTIYEPGRRSLLAAAPEILDRAALYKAGFLRGWMLAPLVLLVVVGVPGGVMWALGRALREEAAKDARAS